MGGHSEHGHGHKPAVPKLPDWRSYKVEECPALLAVQKELAAKGLKDPWMRNEVWRYEPKVFLTVPKRLSIGLFRGFKWGLLAAIITTGITKALESDDHHEHDNGHH